MPSLREKLDDLPESTVNGLRITAADDFAYTDPVDGSKTEHQGARIVFGDIARVVFRLSGTGTVGATLRVYLEKFEDDPTRLNEDTKKMLSALFAAADFLAGIRSRLARDAPDVTT